MSKRKTLDDFWCHDGYCEADCQCRQGLGTCPALEIAREYLKLQAVVDATLGGASLESAIEMFRSIAATCDDEYWREYFGRMRDSLEKLA